MQHTSQKRTARLAAVLVTALVASSFLATPASAAVPTPPTVHIEDGGDGFLNGTEVGAVTVTGAFDPLDGVTRVTGRLVADPDCALDAEFRTDAQDAVLNGDGTYELGPFDISGFPEGTVVCAQARAHNLAGASDRGFSGNLPVIDTTPPAAIIDVLDDAGRVGADLAEIGVEVMYLVEESGPNVTVSVANAGLDAPAACTLTDLPRGPETVFIDAACFAALADGTIEFAVAGEDLAGNVGTAVQTSVLDRILSLEIPGAGQYANAVLTAGGTALPVLFHFGELGDAEAVGVVTVTDGNGGSVVSEPQEMAGTSSPDVRTVLVDVSSLADGPITVDGVVTTEGGSNAASTETILDLAGPATEWATQDGEMSFRLFIPFVYTYGGVSMAGTAADPGLVSPVQFVYIKGRNLDNGDAFGISGTLSQRSSAVTNWSRTRALSAGDWELTAYAQDEAGNLGPAQQITVTVVGPW